MTLGSKIAKLRKDYNYTQEQLAQLLGVSRQTVSKWESDTAYPETSRLVEMGKIFCCSMDYLLKDENPDAPTKNTGESINLTNELGKIFSGIIKERKSEREVFGMPLYHISKEAHGFFAVGLKAKGVFSVGLFSRGIISIGVLSAGVLSFGVISIGLAALGSFALGIIALGAIAAGLFAAGTISLGIVSFGAISVGAFSSGALAFGKYIAIGDNAQAMIAVGKSQVQGSIYRHLGYIQTADITLIKELLDEYVPAIFSWAKALFEMFAL